MRHTSSDSDHQSDSKQPEPNSQDKWFWEHTLYDELRKLAAQKMASEAPEHTLQATALVHEAYLRLVDTNMAQRWDSRGHFFAAAAEGMRRILVENARRKGRQKAGGGWRKVSLDDVEPQVTGPTVDILALDEALKKLEQKDTRKAELVRLRFFTGLTIPQAAEVLQISISTADNDWAYAKGWLQVEMGNDGQPGENE